MKFLKKHLLAQIILAIILGSVLGRFLPESIGRIFITFNTIFGNFLNFAIPLIILGLIVPAIGNIGKGAGKLLLLTSLIAYGSTLFSGFLTYGVSMSTFPSLLSTGDLSSLSEGSKALAPYFDIAMPPMFDVMSGLILSFILGLTIAFNKFPYLENTFKEFEKMVMIIIEKMIIPFLPLFIFGIFMKMTYSGEVFVVFETFITIIGVIFAMHIGLLIIQYAIAGGISGKNPFTMMKNMSSAYFTALGTQSSAATIPVTLEQTVKNKVDPKIAGFTVPLCATIHLAGSTMKITACAIALMLIQGDPVSFIQFAGFICMLGIAMVAAPGVPGGAIMAALGVLASILGFSTQEQSLMIALYIAMDSFGTACNVMGDGAIAVIVDKIHQRWEAKAAAKVA